MLVLFDQGTPVPLRKFLKGHRVETASQKGWDTLRNGDLLNAKFLMAKAERPVHK